MASCLRSLGVWYSNEELVTLPYDDPARKPFNNILHAFIISGSLINIIFDYYDYDFDPKIRQSYHPPRRFKGCEFLEILYRNDEAVAEFLTFPDLHALRLTCSEPRFVLSFKICLLKEGMRLLKAGYQDSEKAILGSVDVMKYLNTVWPRGNIVCSQCKVFPAESIFSECRVCNDSDSDRE
jgi:hypothetical protein